MKEKNQMTTTDRVKLQRDKILDQNARFEAIMNLCDKYGAVKPQEYVLPLDAMTGIAFVSK